MQTLFLYLNLMYHASLPQPEPVVMAQDTLFPTPWVCEPPTCSGDFNCDSIRGTTDVLMMLTAFGLDDSGDIFGNGATDISDLVYLLSKFGIHCDGTNLLNQ